MQTPAGWYRDPTNPTVERWWDGRAWTDHARPASGPDQPRPASDRRPGEGAGSGRVRDAVAVLAVLVVTVTLVVLVAVLRNGAPAPSATRARGADADGGSVAQEPGRPGAVERAELPARGTDFVERTGAYSLRVGEDWAEADVRNGIGWYTGTGSRRFRDNVTAIVEDLPGPIALDDYVRLSVDTIGRAGMGYEEVERRDLVLVDGRPAVVIDYRSSQSGFALGHRVVIALRGRVAVSVTFTAEADRFDDTVGAVAPYLGSVQVR